MKTIGFITCTNFSDLYHDDLHLIKPFANEGIEIVPVIWDEDSDYSDLDALVFRSAWDYHFKTEQFRNWLLEIDNQGVKIFNSPKIILDNHDKFYLKELVQKGVPVIPTLFFENVERVDLKAILETNKWTKGVIKPAISMSAYQTYSFDESNVVQIQQELENNFGQTKVLIQEFAEEIVEEGEWSLVFFEKAFCTAVLKKPKQGDFRVQGELGGTLQAIQPSEKIIQQAQQILFQYEEALLYARVDGIVRNGDFCLMELELIDPELYFRVSPNAISGFLKAIKEKI